MDILTASTQFLRAGIGIIPIKLRDKLPAMQLLPIDPVTGNRTWEPFKTELPSYADLQHWFARPHNYGVLAGWQNLVVLDFDDMIEYTTWQVWAMKSGGMAAYVAQAAYRVSSSRGMHVYIRLPHREMNRKLGKIDIKGNGYVLGPGSIHPTGIEYRAMRDNLNFPVVDALSDILPAALLIPSQASATPAPTNVWQPSPARPAPGSSLVKKVKASYDIEAMFPSARSTGKGWLVDLCPFHDDKHPSFWINTNQQICGCFAGCTPKPLDVINLYGRMHGLSNRDAIFALSSGM
jgi:hypothetical protein